MSYDFVTIEKKWREYWANNKPKKNDNKPKFYCLDMFPYLSASGMHVGHWRGYVLNNVLCRYKILNGLGCILPKIIFTVQTIICKFLRMSKQKKL